MQYVFNQRVVQCSLEQFFGSVLWGVGGLGIVSARGTIHLDTVYVLYFLVPAASLQSPPITGIGLHVGAMNIHT